MNKISDQDLLILRSKLNNLENSKLITKIRELELDNCITKLYIKYNLSPEDNISHETGEIISSESLENSNQEKEDYDEKGVSEGTG